MHINDEQRNFLNQFLCERLTKDDNNKRIIQSFSCIKNQHLAYHLISEAWDIDKSGETVYYIIKTPCGHIAMYFSLKCGALFEPFLGENIAKILKSLYSEEKHKEIVLQIEYEAKHEKNPAIHKVHTTFAGVELVHYCVNDNFKSIWKQYQSKYNIIETHSVGKVLFWRFVIPKIYEINAIVGCKYLYLFAADMTVDRTLVNYYSADLYFQKNDKFSTNKPFYDFACEFMFQPIIQLKEHQEKYFNLFNSPIKEF